MAGRKYDKLKIEDFGAHLIKTGDLDPIYYGLHNMQMPVTQKENWLLAYWTFYDAGVASYLSEQGEGFWDRFKIAGANKQLAPIVGSIPVAEMVNGGWPRGKERRHCRGEAGVKCVADLAKRFEGQQGWPAALIVEGDPARIPFKTIKARVKNWYLFGDWIAFKVGDMLDRCGIHPVEFSLDDAMYEDPTVAALMQWKVWHGAPQDAVIDDEKAAVREVVDRLIAHFASLGFLAPPLADRPIGFQEVETVLCKWKSHMKGSYPLNNDLHEIHTGVKAWGVVSPTARLFSNSLPPIPA